jgi:Cft2 family RNA processing exonuclease
LKINVLILKGDEYLKVTIHGGAREIGGSCIGVQTEDCKVALDYGTRFEDSSRNQFPEDFDAVIISHAHLDHSGQLLSLSKKKPVIIGSKITREVTVALLKDMVKVQSLNDYNYPYFKHNADAIGKYWWVRDHVALPGMTINLHPAGHVAGARMTRIHSEDKDVLYTGDFCVHDSEILEGCNTNALPKKPDVLITESTYGGKVRSPRNELIDDFFRHLLVAMERKGNVLIPTFAFHRSQEMAKRIDDAMKEGVLPRYNVYTISNLANKITDYFNENKECFTKKIQQQKQPFNYSHVKHLYRTGQIKEPAVVICTSGFGHAGASLSLLTDWAEDENNSVLLTSGYLPPDSPLKTAKEERRFRNNGDEISVKAEIEQIELSGHADQFELVQMVQKLKPKRTILVHGDLEQAQALSEEIEEITEVCIPEKGETITI